MCIYVSPWLGSWLRLVTATPMAASYAQYEVSVAICNYIHRVSTVTWESHFRVIVTNRVTNWRISSPVVTRRYKAFVDHDRARCEWVYICQFVTQFMATTRDWDSRGRHSGMSILWIWYPHDRANCVHIYQFVTRFVTATLMLANTARYEPFVDLTTS